MTETGTSTGGSPAAGEPACAGLVFGAALPQVRAYAALLAGPAVERGLLGPAEAVRLWERHLLNCAALLPLLPRQADVVVDVGSGAGLPGVLVAVTRPDLYVIMVEPLLRRTRFLEDCRIMLGLQRTSVVRARAEDLVGELVADVVTARAVAPLDRLVQTALPLCREGGHLLALKGARADAELVTALPALRRLGARSWQVRRCSPAQGVPLATVIDVMAGRGRPSASRTNRRYSSGG